MLCMESMMPMHVFRSAWERYFPFPSTHHSSSSQQRVLVGTDTAGVTYGLSMHHPSFKPSQGTETAEGDGRTVVVQ